VEEADNVKGTDIKGKFILSSDNSDSPKLSKIVTLDRRTDGRTDGQESPYMRHFTLFP
jgi:hypothetical protein